MSKISVEIALFRKVQRCENVKSSWWIKYYFHHFQLIINFFIFNFEPIHTVSFVPKNLKKISRCCSSYLKAGRWLFFITYYCFRPIDDFEINTSKEGCFSQSRLLNLKIFLVRRPLDCTRPSRVHGKISLLTWSSVSQTLVQGTWWGLLRLWTQPPWKSDWLRD